jgi:hypothetical protein
VSYALRSRSLFLMVALCALTSAPLLAQMETATLSGAITDPNGRVVPDAEVDATRIETGTVATTKTNGAGIYFFTGLMPGHYHLMIRKSGFKEIAVKEIQLNVQDKLEQNFSLEIGSVSETVTVEASATTLNTTDATVSTVVDRQFAENLPMNGRSFQTLIELAPGVVVTASSAFDNGQFSVNGQRASSNYWMVDGVSANIGVSTTAEGNGISGSLGSFSILGGTNSLVSVDAMQEFRIQTSTYAPEFGRTPGGQISIVTRSGANGFHGTAFDYLRNTVLDASNWFNGYTNSPPLPKAEERQNDFGGTFSGPILKDRTFFFFSYEGLRLNLPQTTLTTVPCDSTCTVFGNARTMAVPAMQAYLNAFPLPNGPEVFTPCTPNVNGCPSSGQESTGSAQFNASYSDPATLDAYSLRIDHKLNDKWSLFGRYNYSPSNALQRGNGAALSQVSPAKITTQTATIGATWAISTTAANDLRFNYSRTSSSSYDYLDNFGGAVPLESLPFPSGYSSQNGYLSLDIQTLQDPGFFVGAQWQIHQRQINVVDNLSLQRGYHALKFGIDVRRLSPQNAPPPYAQAAAFPDVPSAEMGSTYFGLTYANADLTLLFRNLGLFAQDTWRVAPRLTLTYGLRWDVDFAPSSLNGPSIPAVTGYNLNNFSQLAIAPAGTPPFKTTYGNVAPRFGIAYQLDQNQEWITVLRGGFGVFYDLLTSQAGNLISGGTSPFSGNNFYPGTTFPLSSSQIMRPSIPPATLSDIEMFNPNLKLPYTLEWNVALEQALGKDQTVSASYVGASGKRLIQTTGVDGPPTNPSVFGFFVDNTAISDYNALQLQFNRRLSHGLQALASYTWSHSIDTGSAGSPDIGSNLGVPGSYLANRGPSDFDIRNAFSAGVTYDIPAPKLNTFANMILRGWSTENFILARSAPPVNVSDSEFEMFASGVFADVRPDLVPGQPLYLYRSQCAATFQVLVCPGGKGFNPAAFTSPPVDPSTEFPLRQGDLGRNALRGFGATQWDFAIHRDFPLHESLKLQFRAEMFNVLNHPNFGPPSGAFISGSSEGFGLSSSMLGQTLNSGGLGSGGLSSLYQIGGPRSIQLALKLIF